MEKYFRKLNYQWTENALYEYTESLREAVLRLIQDSEEDKKEKAVNIVMDEIKNLIEDIDNLLNKGAQRESVKCLEFPPPELDQIDLQVIQDITEICDKFRRKAFVLLRSKCPEDRIAEFPFISGGIMNAIFNIQNKVKITLDSLS